MFTLHIQPKKTARLFNTIGLIGNESLYGIPLLEFQAIEGEKVTSFKSLKGVKKYFKENNIEKYDRVTIKKYKVNNEQI